MKTDTLAPSLYPDVLSHNGETYCALLEVGTGLVVMRWPDGFPEHDAIIWVDPQATTHGFPRLHTINGDVFVAYRRDQPAPEHVVCVDLTTGILAPWTVPCVGNSPCCWGNGGKLAVVGFKDGAPWVLVGTWPDKPTLGPMSRDAFQKPTGLSRIDSDTVIFWDEDQAHADPEMQMRVWTEDVTGSVGVTWDDKVNVDILGTRGQILSGHPYKTPRITKEQSGAYTVASHREGSQGPTGVEIVSGITQADLHMPGEDLPPLDSVPLLNRVFGLACYTFNNAETLGNLTLPIRPTVIPMPAQFIATGDDEHLIDDEALWALYSGESQTVPSEQAIAEMRPVGTARKRGLAIYQDSYPMRQSVMDLSEDGDILTPQVFRNAGEDIASYRARLRTAFMDGSINRETWPTINIHQRYSGQIPTLSVKDVVEGFVTATQIAQEMSWPGMVLFRVGTADMPAEIVPYIERFMSGMSGTPEPRVLEDDEPPPDPPEPPEPEEPAMPYVVLTKQDPKTDPILALTEVKEIVQGDKVFLEKTNGRIVTVTPEGKIEDRPPGTFGPWEELIKSAKGYVAKRDGGKVWGIVTA